MKNLIFILLLVISIPGKNFAQQIGNISSNRNLKVNIQDMDSLQLYAYESRTGSGIEIFENKKPAVKDRALKDFSKNCRSEKGVQWEQIDDGDGFVAFHNVNGFKGRRYYDKKGHFICDIITSNESDLPGDVKNAVYNFFHMDYKITGALKVELPQSSFYYVFIENQKYFKKLSVHDGEINIVEEYTNGRN